VFGVAIAKLWNFLAKTRWVEGKNYDDIEAVPPEAGLRK
jgi:hypothetical protein